MREEGDSRKLMAAQALPLSLNALRTGLRILWERAVKISRRPEKRLRLCESLPLGERRFVAVVEFEAERFLVGGTPSSMVLLSRLADCRRQEDGPAPEATLKVKTGKLKTEKLKTGAAGGDAADQTWPSEKRAPC